MIITVLDSDPTAVEVLIESPDFFPDICQFYVVGESETEFSVYKAYVKLGDDYHNEISLDQVRPALRDAGFYDQIFEKLEEAM